MTLAARPRSFKLGPQHWIVAVLLALLLHGLALPFLYPPDPAKAKPRGPKFEISLKPAPPNKAPAKKAPAKKVPKKKATAGATPAPEPKAAAKPPKPQPKPKKLGSIAPTGEKARDEKKATIRKVPSPRPAPAAEPKSTVKAPAPPPPKAAPQAELPPAPAKTEPPLPKIKPKPAEPKKQAKPATPAKPRPKAKKKPISPRQSASRPTKPPVRAKRSRRPRAKPGGRRSRGGPAGVIPNYVAKVQAWLREHKNYPEVAKRNGIQGRVVIQFVMNRRGHVLSHRVVQSSGHQVLDVAAELTLLEASPLPPMPRQMKQKRMRLTYAIEYF